MVQRLLLLLSIPVVMIGCTQKTPEALLQEYRAQRAEVDGKIKALEATMKKPEPDRVPVTVYTVTQANFPHMIDGKGSVESRSSVVVTPRMGGLVTVLNAVNGQTVAKGQLLVELDAEITRRALDEVQTQLDLAVTLYEKQKRIYDSKAGSEVQFLTAKNQKEALERRLASVQEQIAMSKIYAPTSGVIDNVMPKLGENVAPGMPLMTIVNTSDMRIAVDVAETYVANVQPGDPVTMVFSDLGDTIRTSVAIVSRNINPVSRTFRVEIPIRPVPAGLRPNMTASVSINDITLKDAITVPLLAIVRDGKRAFVYVVDDKGVVARRDVTIGYVVGPTAQITTGLAPGERVVTSGVLDVSDGQVVSVVQ